MPAEESEMARAKTSIKTISRPSRKSKSAFAAPVEREAVERERLQSPIMLAVKLLRTRTPRVHALTNIVAQHFTANVLLAVGATPSMTVAADEVADFTSSANALLVNIGTLDANLHKAIPRAIAAARKGGKPFVLDPVLIDRSRLRLKLADAILAAGPTVVRANAAEFAALAGVAASDPAAMHFAREHQCVIAITGPVDLVTDGRRIAQLANGHPLMARVTAIGCAASALVAAFAAVEPDPFVATVAALSTINVAGEIAGKDAKGPGTFAVALLDAIHALEPGALAAQLRTAP
jgi:hydroxyethylthiazole kinase